MFGSSTPSKETGVESTSTESADPKSTTNPPTKASEDVAGREKRGKNPSPQGRLVADNGEKDKKRRSSGVGSKASSFLHSAKSSLHFSQNPNSAGFMRGSDDSKTQTPLQKLGKQDPALSVPQGQHNNSAGESVPGPRSTFTVGVWEDRNKKCRRTMEDTHAFLYNFLHTPAPALGNDTQSSSEELASSAASLAPTESSATEMIETDNGYFAIFDGHAGTFAADWCGKKLHLILEETIRKNPNTPIPELLDQTFTTVDNQLEKLPLKNSGCTAVTAVLRWEDRIPNSQSATGSTAIAPATAAAVEAEKASNPEAINAKLRTSATRQRVLYTANVGDARIVLCRNGKALRLSYDHKGSDENEGRRVANAGGLILNNRVNGVLAVTRALGDAYMKDLVTGHPYTTETVIQPDMDEFIILACDGLWDVCTDQEAVDLIRNISSPSTASKMLVDHALTRFSTDNLSVMVVKFNRHANPSPNNSTTNATTEAISEETGKGGLIGVEGDSLPSQSKGKKLVSEAEKIVNEARKKVASEGGVAVGVSGSNSGRGHDPVFVTGGEVPEEAVVDDAAGKEEDLILKEPPPPKNVDENVLEREKAELAKVLKEDPTEKLANAGEDSKEVDTEKLKVEDGNAVKKA